MSGKKNNLIKIGAIWVGETKNGDDMLSMSIRVGDEEFSCVAFTNDYKKESKHPDFLIYGNEEVEEQKTEQPKKRFGQKKFNKADENVPEFKSKSKFKKRSPFV